MEINGLTELKFF